MGLWEGHFCVVALLRIECQVYILRYSGSVVVHMSMLVTRGVLCFLVGCY